MTLFFTSNTTIPYTSEIKTTNIISGQIGRQLERGGYHHMNDFDFHLKSIANESLCVFSVLFDMSENLLHVLYSNAYFIQYFLFFESFSINYTHMHIVYAPDHICLWAREIKVSVFFFFHFYRLHNMSTYISFWFIFLSLL